MPPCDWLIRVRVMEIKKNITQPIRAVLLFRMLYNFPYSKKAFLYDVEMSQNLTL